MHGPFPPLLLRCMAIIASESYILLKAYRSALSQMNLQQLHSVTEVVFAFHNLETF